MKDFFKKIIFRCYGCNKIGFIWNHKYGFSYWHAVRKDFHKRCDNRKNAYECQKIDADCNDCKFFKRGKIVRPLGRKSKHCDYFIGDCLKFNKPTEAFPNHFTGHKCFKHRNEKN